MRPAGIAIALLVCSASLLPLSRGGAPFEREAHASVAVAITWDDLLRTSAAAVVVTPIESTAVWENGRIRTYTRMHIEQSVAGELASGSTTWVRTLGGVVGKIGQLVEGEATFVQGQRSLLFLQPAPAGSYEVTARAQGQFPIMSLGGQAAPRVVRSGSAGALVAPWLKASSQGNRLASEVLHDRPVGDALSDVAADWPRTHAN
ncbi:MAG TPA: hypothetical protein VGM06_00520 [Polyangiaceae bacterium]|jgi:hypothetical protein